MAQKPKEVLENNRQLDPPSGTAYHSEKSKFLRVLQHEKQPDAHSHGKHQQVPGRRQSWFILTTGLFAVVIALLLGGVIRAYEQKGVLTEEDEHIFTAVTEGLLIILGLNNHAALKSLAVSFRDWSLPQRKWSKNTEHLIGKISEFKDLMFLVVRKRTKWLLRLIAFVWLIVALAPQALTASSAFGYSVQDGTDYNGTYTESGKVNISDLACFEPAYYPEVSCKADGDVAAAQAIAHAYGDVDQDIHCRELDTMAEIFSSPDDEDCFFIRDSSQVAYRFDEYNPGDIHKAYPRFTNRTVVASTGVCINYTQVSVISLPGGESRFTYGNGTWNGTVDIPDYVIAENGTIYIYRDHNPPQIAAEYACGPRCIRNLAYGSLSPGTSPQFYECPVTISEVANITESEHAISNDVARLAAASIGLSGHSLKNDGNWTQYQLYPYGSTWNALSHYTRHPVIPPPYLRPGDIMATAALSALSVMAKTNRQLQMDDGIVPILGSRVTVEWRKLLGILAGILAGHAIVASGCLFFDRKAAQQNQSGNDSGVNAPEIEV